MSSKIRIVWLLGLCTSLASADINRVAPFEAIDPQAWVSPDNMTWEDFKEPPGTQWNDPAKQGSVRNFNIAVVTVDFDDRLFAITMPPNTTTFGNPLPVAANIDREAVPLFYREFLNHPTELNGGRTMHEYWMADSQGRYGINLTAFGPYRMPSLAYQYGIENTTNAAACPVGDTCGLDLQKDATNAWANDVGHLNSSAFEFVFILSAGEDESSTWQEFGEMKFTNKEDVPSSFGPPIPSGDGNTSLPNYAGTKNAYWTSWAAASNIWPRSAGNISILCESSGLAAYSHELSHLLNVNNNYGNPYKTPFAREYTGPWSIMSQGRFNGPGGPHTRYQIPPLQGGSMGSLHTLHDRLQLGFISYDHILRISTEELSYLGVIVANITARSVTSDLTGIRVELGRDLSPPCSKLMDVLCDGGGYHNYDIEVIDRMGADSFQSDSGVMISKTRNSNDSPYQWTIDAKPEDIGLIDFFPPDGPAVWVPGNDYRQLSDALFHAGTRSGSRFEHRDEANGLHIYILDSRRDKNYILSHTVAIRSLNVSVPNSYGIHIAPGYPIKTLRSAPIANGVLCAFEMTNTGTYGGHGHTPDYMSGDVYRLKVDIIGAGWRTQLPSAVVAARFGETITTFVSVGADIDATTYFGVVRMRATSESNPDVHAEAWCRVTIAFDNS